MWTRQAGGDPWSAFGYLVAGVGVYGLLGWGLGVWLNASYLTAVGILVGAVLGLVLIFYQFGRSQDTDRTTSSATGRDRRDDPRAPRAEDQHDQHLDQHEDQHEDRGETE